jgi:hypothetical protein
MNVRRSTLMPDRESQAGSRCPFIACYTRRVSEDVREQEDQQQDAARNTK